MFRFSFRRLAAEVLDVAKHVTVSDRCVARVCEVNKSNAWGPQPRPLRLKIVPGGCQGFSYEFLFEEKPIDPNKDIILAKGAIASLAEGPQVVVDKKSVTKLQGATIDYHIELKGSAFVVVGNEMVDASCACGQSFSMIKAQKEQKAAKAKATGTTTSAPSSSPPQSSAADSATSQEISASEPSASGSGANQSPTSSGLGQKLSINLKPSTAQSS
jgi:iron-sulfur cluster assembly accessory protein